MTQKIAIVHNIRNIENLKTTEEAVKRVKKNCMVRGTGEKRGKGWASDFFVRRLLVLFDLLKYFNKKYDIIFIILLG